MGKEAVKFVIGLGDIAAESGRIPKGGFVRWETQLKVQRGNAEMYRRNGLVISRDQGLRSDDGLAVLVLMPWYDMGMVRRWRLCLLCSEAVCG